MTACITATALSYGLLAVMSAWLYGIVVAPIADRLAPATRDRFWRIGCRLHPVLPGIVGCWWAVTTWSITADRESAALTAGASVIAITWLLVWAMFRNFDRDLWKGW